MAVCVDVKNHLTKITSDEPFGSSMDRGRRKKTKSKGPALIFTITDVERQKLEEEKASIVDFRKSIVAKAFFKLAAFSYLKQVKTPDGARTESIVQPDDAESSPPRLSNGFIPNSTSTSSAVDRTLSLPPSFILRSALRGGREDKGLGPRPKLHVRWAPDVDATMKKNLKLRPSGKYSKLN